MRVQFLSCQRVRDLLCAAIYSLLFFCGFSCAATPEEWRELIRRALSPVGDGLYENGQELLNALPSDMGENRSIFSVESGLGGYINQQLKDSKSEVLINLASNEYFKSVKPKLLSTPMITPNFKELREDGSYKVIGLFAKRARGMMAAYILKNKITDAEKIKDFNEAGYQYNAELSTTKDWIFTRDKVPGK